jgi:23S rRNA (cytidine1920-2'-O)/16S rRNA (cytidine1409-2'-O)-methyltransferase
LTKVRLDEALVARGLYPTRSRARDAVKRGVVRVRGEVAEKPGRMVEVGDAIEVEDAARGRVSRAGLKLAAALDRFAIDVTGRRALDIGASTGGFTEVLLERGVLHVTALDVGHGQLAPALRFDPRVTVLEGLNARDLTADRLPHRPDLVVCDVSFISLKLALPPALSLAAPGAVLVALIKPQFEAGREAVGKGGIVRDPAVHERVCRDIAAFLEREGWRVLGLVPSPIEGSDGNREFLIAAAKP